MTYDRRRILKEINLNDCVIGAKTPQRETGFDIASCKAVVEVVERSRSATADSGPYEIVDKIYSLIICKDMNFCVPVDYDFLKDVQRYFIKADILQSNGETRSFCSDSIIPVRLELDGEWKFRVIERDAERLKELMQ